MWYIYVGNDDSAVQVSYGCYVHNYEASVSALLLSYKMRQPSK